MDEKLRKLLFTAPIIPDPLKGDIVTYDVDRDGNLRVLKRESIRIIYFINKLRK